MKTKLQLLKEQKQHIEKQISDLESMNFEQGRLKHQVLGKDSDTLTTFYTIRIKCRRGHKFGYKEIIRAESEEQLLSELDTLGSDISAMSCLIRERLKEDSDTSNTEQ